MPPTMNNPADRRAFKRIPTIRPARVKSGALEGQVKDIRMGGMAIIHRGPGIWPWAGGLVSLQVADQQFQLPVRMIWDRVLLEDIKSEERLHRCGIQFAPLTEKELFRLEYFLWSQTEGWPRIPTPEGAEQD